MIAPLQTGQLPPYSVLMSLYKKEHPGYLRASLDSMLAQTIPPSEIVLVEDGPLTDELHAVVDDFAARTPGLFKIVKNPTNLGLGLSLRKGVESCTCEWIARMDTDDISVPDRCEKQLRYLHAHPGITIVGGMTSEFETDTAHPTSQRSAPTSDAELKAFLPKRCPFSHMTVMFKKSDILAAGNYRDWFWNEDYDLWIRLALSGFAFANLPEVLVFSRGGPDRYRRRGGLKYFKSELRIQLFLLREGLSSFPLFLSNTAKRFVVEILMTPSLRVWAYRRFARQPVPSPQEARP